MLTLVFEATTERRDRDNERHKDAALLVADSTSVRVQGADKNKKIYAHKYVCGQMPTRTL